MVMAVHTLTRDTQPQWLAKLGEQGARGVELFFVVSAFTLCLSWAARDDTASRFYLRRFFRIAPMFWLAIPFFLYLRGWEDNGVRQVIAAATFTHGLWPDTLFGVVPGGWSVATEAIFYALFPFAIVPLMACRWRTFMIVMAVGVVGGAQTPRPLGVRYQSHPELWNNDLRFFFDTWFPRLLPCFLFGVALYRIHAQGISFSRATSLVLTVTGGALFVAMTFLYGVRYAVPFGLSITAAFCFFLIILGLFDFKPLSLVNPATIWIGKVSYSVYFLHFAVLLAIPSVSLSGLPSTQYRPPRPCPLCNHFRRISRARFHHLRSD